MGKRPGELEMKHSSFVIFLGNGSRTSEHTARQERGFDRLYGYSIELQWKSCLREMERHNANVLVENRTGKKCKAALLGR
jgi:hypothetical protein